MSLIFLNLFINLELIQSMDPGPIELVLTGFKWMDSGLPISRIEALVPVSGLQGLA